MLFMNYEYFLKIVEYKSISKAAEHLFVSQPSLTKYLQRLESTVGARLFDRTRSPLTLTAAGESFYAYVLQVQEAEKTLTKQIYEIKNCGRDRIHIGMALWRANVLLPEFLPYFLEKYPLIEVNLTEGPANETEEAIQNDKIDFGIMNLPVNYENMNYETISEEHILLVGSRKNKLIQQMMNEPASSAFIHADLEQLCQEPFILTQPNQHITNYVNRMLSRNNLELNCIFRTANVATAVNLAAADLGFTFVPELGTRCKSFPAKDVALFTVDTPPLRCTLAAVYKRSRYLSNAARLFISELQDFCARQNI